MRRNELQNNLAMTLVLISGAMLFTTLLMGYAIFRTSNATWPPMGLGKIPLGYPVLSTVTILVSSWFSHQVRRKIDGNDFVTARLNLHMTLALGFIFLGIQTLFWSSLKHTGIFVDSGIFASVIYGFTWIHAAHVIAGLLSLLWLRFSWNQEDPRLSQKALNVEKFWHFLGIVWIVMFLTLFVF